MNLLTKKDQANNSRPKVGPMRSGVRLGRFVWPAALCVAFMINHAAAQCSGGEEPVVQKTAIPKPGGAPSWSCPEATVTVEPVWYGQQIECPFTIRNEGTANLTIKARGG